MADEQTSQDMQAIARRCLEDPEFAQELINGEEYPTLREALLEDIAEASEVQGFLNPCPLPPRYVGRSLDRSTVSPAAFSKVQWNTFAFTRVSNFALRGY